MRILGVVEELQYIMHWCGIASHSTYVSLKSSIVFLSVILAQNRSPKLIPQCSVGLRSGLLMGCSIIPLPKFWRQTLINPHYRDGSHQLEAKSSFPDCKALGIWFQQDPKPFFPFFNELNTNYDRNEFCSIDPPRHTSSTNKTISWCWN